MIATTAPANFQPIYHVASCFVERNGEILLLLRLPHKSEGNKWGVPAGKIEVSEEASETIIREVKEETGLVIAEPRLFQRYFVRYDEYDFVYYVFHSEISPYDEAITNPAEHQGFRWETPARALELDLVKHQDHCIKEFYFQNSGIIKTRLS